MKTSLLLVAASFALGLPVLTHAADTPSPDVAPAGAKAHRAVFEVTSADAAVWNGVLNNVENLRAALGPTTQVEVVAHGSGLGFLLRTNEAQTERMRKLAAAGVVFAACRNTMKRQHVTAEALLPFATSVDSGVAELVRRQEDGWAYVHAGP